MNTNNKQAEVVSKPEIPAKAPTATPDKSVAPSTTAKESSTAVRVKKNTVEEETPKFVSRRVWPD